MKCFLKTFFVLFLVLGTISAKSQQFKNNISQYKAKIAGEAAKLIDSGNVFLSADSLQPFFKVNGYNPVSANLKPMKKKKLTPAEIYNCVSKSTVIVSSAGRCGEINSRGVECMRVHTFPASGYIIDAEGIVVTNYHVVDGYVTKNNSTSRDVLVVMLQDGTIFPVEKLLLADKSNDIAIIKINPNEVELTPLPIATKDAEIGDPVYIVSHPKGYFYAFSSGMVTDKFSEINARQYRNLMAISADYAAGSSGAAIIDKYGNAIGTVSYTKTLQHSDDDSKTQMVLKATIPSSALLNLITKGN